MNKRQAKKAAAKAAAVTTTTMAQTILRLKVEKAVSGAVISSEEFEDVVEESPFAGQPAMVSWGYGRTRNLGNFESLRVDCAVSLPCSPGQVPEMINVAQGLVRSALTEFMASGRKTGGGSQPSNGRL